MRTWWVMAMLASSVQVAVADEAAEPWKAGVSIESQDRANGLSAQGNDLFAKQAFPQAPRLRIEYRTAGGGAAASAAWSF